MDLIISLTIVVLFHYGRCQRCNCKDINMLKTIVLTEMEERINLATKLALVEKRLVSSDIGIVSKTQHTDGSQDVAIKLKGNLKEELLALTVERQRSARLNAALTRAWKIQKQMVLMAIDSFGSAVKDTTQTLIDYRNENDNLVKSLSERTDSILKDVETLTRLETRYESFQSKTQHNIETIRDHVTQNFKDFADSIAAINSTQNSVLSICGWSNVAFFVGLTQLVDANGTIIFDKVFVDTNHAYQPETGQFVAPVGGLYLFSYHFLTQKKSGAKLKLYLNDRYITSSFGHMSDGFGASGNTVILVLKPGDVVHVQAERNSKLYGEANDIYCTFSGHIIHPTPRT